MLDCYEKIQLTQRVSKFSPKKFYKINPMGLYYKLFNTVLFRARYVLVTRNIELFVPVTYFHPSLMFLGKTGTLTVGALYETLL